jgi:hypothetical protein
VIALNIPIAEVPREVIDPSAVKEGREEKEKKRQESKNRGQKRATRTELSLSRRNGQMPCGREMLS